MYIRLKKDEGEIAFDIQRAGKPAVYFYRSDFVEEVLKNRPFRPKVHVKVPRPRTPRTQLVPRISQEILTRLMEGRMPARVAIGVKDADFSYEFD